jgi:Protein of unknown function (DUF2950)
MRQHLGTRRSLRRCELTTAVLALIAAACLREGAHAQQPGQKTFASAEAAATALVAAARSGDSKAMLDVLGPDAQRIVSSGDPREDASARAQFLKRFDQMRRLVNEPDGTTTLYVGADNWPLPIPLVSAGEVWYFDTDAGRREILYRRIGRNEMSAIRVSGELVASEKEFRSTHDNYARRIFSPAGTHDGLYWTANTGEAKSPIGPMVAAAVAPGNEGQPGSRTPVPFRGYYFHLLTSQGAHARGGAHTYVADGKMTGFAFVAYPAEYRSSGVVTFIVGEDGVVYQRDLGKQTEALAKALTLYDPDSSWRKAEGELPAADTGASPPH